MNFSSSSKNKSTIKKMQEAASSFYDNLDAKARNKALFHYLDGERIFWYYPPLNRHGLPLKDMTKELKSLVFTLLETGLSSDAFNQTLQIINHELILKELEIRENIKTFVRDPERYYFTIFGNPKSKDPWGWRFEGHHVSIHFSIWSDKIISVTPLFLGVNPAEVKDGDSKGLRILKKREDLAFELVNSMSKDQHHIATIYENTPKDIITYNSSRVTVPVVEGISWDELKIGQQKLLKLLIAEYVNQVNPNLVKSKLEYLESNTLKSVKFGWAGGINLGEAYYYRIHGGNLFIELDNYQSGANHVHSVWRDVENDFAQDVLRKHLLSYHVL
ncbi:MAG: hypothetical protein CL766_02995 [Chloroflexi bacterium]|nr:hypothetical protein [Chloroflexota bacterium]|tara:strand:- start:7047 stop:8039 length:993 start_codon:yes stop_codon:yes gene_type:complete